VVCECARAKAEDRRPGPTWSALKLVRRAPAAAAAAASACGLTKGLLDGTRSSLRVWAKKQTRRLQLVPSLHSCVRYLRPEQFDPSAVTHPA
jgi:hypothetical protein